MNKVQNRLLAVVTGALLLVSIMYMGREAAYYTTGKNVSVGEEQKCVVIDAGQGGSK